MSSESPLKRTLRIPQRELDALLDAADHSTSSRGGASKRRSRRWTLRNTSVVLTLQAQAGGHTHFLVAPRNLSSNGMGLIHGGFIHIGTRCVVSLRNRSGSTTSIPGRIVKCRLMRGNLHDVGVEFESTINPLDYVEPTGDHAFNVESVEPASLSGTLLILDDDRSMQKLLAHYLRDTKCEATYATDAEAALKCLKDEPDIVFVDLEMPVKDGISFIREARAKHYMAPLIALTAHNSPEMRAKVSEAGGSGYLTKPITMELFHQAIAEHLSSSVTVSDGPLIHSTLSALPPEGELVLGYIEELRRSADTLAAHIEQNQLDDLKRIVLNIRGTAAGHGFSPITAIADSALGALQSADTAEPAARELQALIAACHRARPPRGEDGAPAEPAPGPATTPTDGATADQKPAPDASTLAPKAE